MVLSEQNLFFKCEIHIPANPQSTKNLEMSRNLCIDIIKDNVWIYENQTGRFDEKLGDFQENLESRQVWIHVTEHV